MISSARKLKVPTEFVLNESITLSSTPALASLMISAVAGLGLRFAGTSISVETFFAGAVDMLCASASAIISSGSMSAEVSAGSTAGLSGGLATSAAATACDEIELSCKQPANGRTERTSPRTQLEQIRLLMV
jgi:hypothetical protein